MANITAYYVDTDTFIVSGSGDQTGIFHAGRRVQAYCGPDGFKYGTIDSSSYAAPNNTINLTSSSDALTPNLLSVKYGIVSDTPSGSLPVHDHTSDQGQGGVLSYASEAYVDTKSAEASANAYQQVLNDDYMPTDASKSFSNPVSGQDPTQDVHLATRAYVLSVIPSGGVTDFTDLTDTPSDYSGDALKLLRVNGAETGVEFIPSGTFATPSYVDTEVASVSAAAEDYADAGDAATLASAQTYAETASANALAQANAYTDTEVASVSAASDEADNVVLATSLAYTDSEVASVSAAADEGDNQTLASANSYSDAASANALAQANAYTDAVSAANDPLYSLVDGSRPFTNPVGGQTPVADSDLATKAYVQSQIPSGGGATTFLGLTDTPASYSGQADKILRVKGNETGVEFIPSATFATEAYVDERINMNTLNWYISPSGSDVTGDGTINNPFQTIGETFNLARDLVSLNGSYVRIYLKDGIFAGSLGSDMSVPQYAGDTSIGSTANHPKIIFEGLHSYATTVTSVQATSGSATDYGYTLNVADASNIQIGNLVGIYSATGGTNPLLVEGAHIVLGVDYGNNRILVHSRNRSSNVPSGAVTATVKIHKAIWQITGNVYMWGGALAFRNMGIYRPSGTYTWRLNNPGCMVEMGGVAMYLGNGAGGGVSQGPWAIDGAYLYISDKTQISDPTTNGIYVRNGRLGGNVNELTLGGCNRAIQVTQNGNAEAQGAVFAGNIYGVYASERSYARIDDSDFESNTTVDIYAEDYSYIQANGTSHLNATDDFDPNANTEGNTGAYINTTT